MTPAALRTPLVLFDLDGTLLDTVPFITESHQHAWVKHTGRRGDLARILATIGRPIEFAFDDAAPELRRAMADTYLAHNVAHNDERIGLFLGVPRMLDGLVRLGARIGVVTSKRRAITDRCLALFELDGRFGLVVAKEDTARHKPFPDPLLFAMERAGETDPSRVLYVGDTIHDLLCAKNAGIPCAIVGWTAMDRAEIVAAGPDFWIEEPDDLVLACLAGGRARPTGVDGGPGPFAAWRSLGTAFGPGSGRDEEVVFACVRPEDGRVAAVHVRGTPADAFRLPSGGRARSEEIVAAVLREAGEEYGATTGRPRRCGWLDLPALRYAARVNGLTRLVVTKLDVLDAFDEILVADAYESGGAPVRGFPASASALERCRPVWRRFPGWKSGTVGVRHWADLPAAARSYLEWIEREVGVPISSVSVGPARDAEVPRG